MEMKTCSNCKIEKPVGEFHTKRRKTKTYLYAQCKGCHRRYARDHYVRNKAAYLVRIHARTAVITREARVFLVDYLKAHPCVDCGESDLVVLQFDHCRGEKRKEISNMVRQGWSLKTIKAEITKCDVVCANCHSRRTAKQFGWWSLAL